MNRQAVVLENKKIASSYYKMRLSCDGISGASPGQFMMIKVSPNYDPFLRRPMSFYRIIPPLSPHLEGGEGEGLKGGEGGFEILYQVAGKGTGIMSEFKKGDSVDILAPLGRGFLIPEKMERAILVAGGIGVAPMVALSEKIQKRGKISVFIGGKTKDDILCTEDFERIGTDVYIATEDGSMGKKGTCVDLLSAFSLQPSAFIFACGPHGMLKAVADIARDKNMPCQVSLDKRMACGTGACLGCVVKVKSQESGACPERSRRVGSQESKFNLSGSDSRLYKCVCTDGPVFDARDINWEEI